MPCFHPLKGYRSRTVNKDTGKRKIVFNTRDGYTDMPVEVPCGQCIGCRLERSRQWAIRCVHESKLYEKNCFVTLTYNDEHLPKDGSLVKRDLQNFLKRLRKKYGEGIRFFACGEYGEKFSRPHYHLCIFNFDFSDKKPFKIHNGFKTYTSRCLESLWEYGYSTIGDVTFESAAYVARYVTKKITGKNASDHYEEIDYTTGEIIKERKPEFCTMSRRPGLGREFLEKWQKDIYTGDFVILRGKKLRPPKYYDKRFEIENPNKMLKIKNKRKGLTKKNAMDNTSERLRVKEEIQNSRYKLLKRSYENEKDLFGL